MSRVYEVMFIVRPDVAEEDVDKLIAGFTTNVTNGGGVVKNVEKMGRRKLAYLVRKFNDGNYILMTIEAGGAGGARTRASPARLRAGHQVHHGAHRRGRKASGEGQGTARYTPQGQRGSAGCSRPRPGCRCCRRPRCPGCRSSRERRGQRLGFTGFSLPSPRKGPARSRSTLHFCAPHEDQKANRIKRKRNG